MRNRLTFLLPLFLALMLTISLVPGCSPADDSSSEPILTITKDNNVHSYTMKDIKAMPATEGTGCLLNSSGDVLGPFQVKGVALDELCNTVGGVGTTEAARIIAKDGYSMTISYPRLNENAYLTFDAATAKECPHGDLSTILAYEVDGNPIDETSDGPLRLLVVGGKDLATEGHWWVKWVNEIEIFNLNEPWTLNLEGAITENMDSDTFRTVAAPGRHQVTWTDGQDRPWAGLPLWLLVGRVDDEDTQSDCTFNDALADAGYEVQIIAADGYTVTMSSEDVKGNNDLLVVYLCREEPLGEKYWPLRLVGPGMEKSQMVGQIAEIKIVFPS
jgi:hypothetical protein